MWSLWLGSLIKAHEIVGRIELLAVVGLIPHSLSGRQLGGSFSAPTGHLSFPVTWLPLQHEFVPSRSAKWQGLLGGSVA